MISREENGLHVEAFALKHGNVENLAFLVNLNGEIVLHIGDADLPLSNDGRLKLPTRKIDVAFIPFWQLTENAGVIRTEIAAKTVVPMHLITHPATAESRAYREHENGFNGMLNSIQAAFPNAAIFGAPLETKTFP